MDKIKLLLLLYLIASPVSAANLGRWSRDDYREFCAESAREIFGWTYDDYYDTDVTNATNCVLYPFYGFPDDFWVNVPENIDSRERCLFKHDCPASAWASEWFNLSFKQEESERQVCGYCVALYYALHDLDRTLPDNATNTEVLKAIDKYGWGSEWVESGTSYCVDGECAFTCRKAVELNVRKCEQRKDRECQSKLGLANMTVSGIDECPVCPICEKCAPPVECRKCPDCPVCMDCPTCEDCSKYQVEIDSLKQTINSLNQELIFYKESNISSVDAGFDVPDIDRMYIFILAGVLLVIVVVAGLLMR